MLREKTGITHYRNTYRPATVQFIRRHSGDIALAFKQVSTGSTVVYDKVRRVASLIESLGEISAGGRNVSPFNGLTPVLSCLDPQRRFPIMNQRTRRLLKGIQKNADMEGAVALAKLIDPNYDIRDARELDVYANTEKFPKLKFIFAEYGFLWVASLFYRLDRTWRGLRHEVPWVRKSPSEYPLPIK